MAPLYRMTRVSLLLGCLLSCLTVHGAPAGDETQVSARILGEPFSLSLTGPEPARVQRVAADVLAEVKRLAGILDDERPDSALRQLNRSGRLDDAPPELLQVLTLCEQWREKTDDAWSCRLGSVLALWRDAEASGEVPDRGEVRAVARQLAAAPWRGDGAEGVQWAPAGLARAFVIDAAVRQLAASGYRAQSVRVALGADVYYQGGDGAPFAVAGDPALGRLKLQGRAMAWAGQGREHRQVGHRRFSRVIDPADGWPVVSPPSAVAVADDAVTAHVLAASLAVRPATRGLALIERLPGVEALIVTESGKSFASTGWYPLLLPEGPHQPPWGEESEFLVEYQIPSHPVAEYRRPYVAIWITDTERQPVRQLLVHGDSLRWLREIPLWWRRYGRRDESMIDGLTRATPIPGWHRLVWDGRDDGGRRVGNGSYLLQLEAAREHGGRELVTLPFELTGRAFRQQARGERELGSVRVSFGPRS